MSRAKEELWIAHSLLLFNSSVIATNLLAVDEILRAGRSSLKSEGPGMGA